MLRAKLPPLKGCHPYANEVWSADTTSVRFDSVAPSTNQQLNTMTKVKLTQTQINEAINALEEANRILNKLTAEYYETWIDGVKWIERMMPVTAEEIDNLKEEVQSARATLSKAQHKQTFTI